MPFKLYIKNNITITINSKTLYANISTKDKHTKQPTIVKIRRSSFCFITSPFNDTNIIVAKITPNNIIQNDKSQNNLLNFKGSLNDLDKLYSL